MKIYRGNIEIADVPLKLSSNRHTSYTVEEISGQFIFYAEFDVLNPIGLNINDWISYMGNTYYVRHKENIKKEETSLGYSYKVTFYHEIYRLQDIPFLLYDTIELKKNVNTYYGTAAQMLALIIKSMNKELSGWVVGECPDTDAETFDCQDKMCSDIVNELVSRYGIEYWAEGKTLSLGRREYASNGLVLSQGVDGGFRNLELSAVDDTPPVTRLVGYGSDINISKEYGDYLMLPGGIKYLEKNVDKYGIKYQYKQFDKIFPKGKFTISEVVDTYNFKASDINFDIAAHLLEGVEIILTFQTGQLAGYDLAVWMSDDGKSIGWDNATKQIRVVKHSNENALNVPGDINFSVGDTFIITGIKMPEIYRTEAEQKLLEEATKHLDQICENKVQLRGDCDENVFAERDLFIAPGQMVGVFDSKLELEREIRVTAVKRYVEDEGETPYRYELTLSDFLSGNGFKEMVDALKEIPKDTDSKVNQVKDLAKRNWRDVKELAASLPEMFTEFSESINPVSVNAMQMYLGSEKLQYMFVASKTSENEIAHEFFYNKDTKIFSTPSGVIRHMTLGIDTLKPTHALGEYKHWNVSAFSSLPLGDGDARWLYIKASKSSETAEFLFSKVKIEDTADHHYFIVGFLNSEYAGTRSWASMYGWSEWTPGALRVNKIASTDGSNFLDLLGKQFRVGDGNTSLEWNINNDKTLRLKGIMVQSPSGDESPLGVMIGAYSSTRQYYAGDEVTYNGSTYRALKDVKGITPTNTAYWRVIAQAGKDGVGKDGKPGKNGEGIRHIYYPVPSSSAPSTPNGTGANTPSGWWTYPSYPGTAYSAIYVSQSTYDGTTWSAWSTPTLYSQKGIPGALPTMRKWVNGATYYRNERTVDYIIYRKDTKSAAEWYRLREGYTSVVATATPDLSYFEKISSYEAIATTVLLAEEANLAGFIFKNGWLLSNNGDSPLLRINGNTGELYAKSATIGGFKIENNTLTWRDWGDGALIKLGYSYSYSRNTCITVQADFLGIGLTALNPVGGCAIFASMYSTPSFPSTTYLYAMYLDGDLVVTRGNIFATGGGVAGKGVMQADRMLPQNGWSGSFKGKTVKVENGIITNVT